MYQLMCKDDVRAEFDLVKHAMGVRLNNLKVLGTLPTGCTEKNFFKFLQSRNASKHRSHLQGYLNQIGHNDIIGFLDLTHGISINDCYWVKNVSETLMWKDVSPYTNEYSEIIQHLAFDGVGLFGVDMSSISPEFCISGNFDKCCVREGNKIFMYKRGSDIASNSGLEPYCEVLASQVFSKMRAGIPYKLVHFRHKVASKCKLFNNENVSFRSYGVVYPDNVDVYSIIDKYDSIDASQTFRRILVCDALTLNTDRHLGNHGFLCDSETEQIVHAAPGYDYNLSLLPYCTLDDLADIRDCIDSAAPRIGSNFIDVARAALTSDIRKDLVNLKGIELSLPFYDERFTEARTSYMTDIVNTQIDNVLGKGKQIYPTFKVEGISNCMRYRLKYGFSQDEWVHEVPRLMQLLCIRHMSELEAEIHKLL